MKVEVKFHFLFLWGLYSRFPPCGSVFLSLHCRLLCFCVLGHYFIMYYLSSFYLLLLRPHNSVLKQFIHLACVCLLVSMKGNKIKTLRESSQFKIVSLYINTG